jgi:hypothetical protein
MNKIQHHNQKCINFIEKILNFYNKTLSNELLKAKNTSFQAITKEDLIKFNNKKDLIKFKTKA